MTFFVDRDLTGPEFLRELFQHECDVQARIVYTPPQPISHAEDLLIRHAYNRAAHDFIAVHGLGNYSLQAERSHLSVSGLAVILKKERAPTEEERSLDPQYCDASRLAQFAIITRVMPGFLKPDATTLEQQLLEGVPIGLHHMQSQVWLARNGTIYTNGWKAGDAFDKNNTRVVGEVLPTMAVVPKPGRTGLIFQYHFGDLAYHETIVVPSYEHA
jgi:hypothetical protein